MKYLITETKMFRCENEKEAEDFLKELKQDHSFEIVSSTVSKKELKSKGEIIDTWVRLTIKVVHNDEKEPECVYYGHAKQMEEE